MKDIDTAELRRLAGKLRADPHQRVNTARYPWRALATFAEAWEAANPAEAAQEPTKTIAPMTNAPPPAPAIDHTEEAKGIAEHISAAQAECLRTVFDDGHVGDAGKATVGALVNKGLIVMANDPEDGVDITPLGEAVAALLASA